MPDPASGWQCPNCATILNPHTQTCPYCDTHANTPGNPGSPFQPLSPRERQILRDLALGYTSRQIARRLFLSETTVKTYRRRAASKLGAENTRVQLTAYALTHGLVAPTPEKEVA